MFKTVTGVVGMVAAATAALVMTAAPAGAAAPAKFTFSTSGVSADAVFTNAPMDSDLVAGKVYTDVFVTAADQASTENGTTYTDDFAFVDVFSYKIDRRGNFTPVSSSFGFAGGDDVAFNGDARRLSTATLTARLDMQKCNAQGCASTGVSDVSVTWSGTGATTTYRGTVRTNDPGQFHTSTRFNGTERQATASGSVPVLGNADAVFASIRSGTDTSRTICHAC